MNTTTEAASAIDAGIAADNPQLARDIADVRRWADRVGKGRKFDEEALKQYAKDRRYARGDSGFSVDANILGTFIDILVAFLYAKDPEVDVLPAKATEPPGIDAIRDAAELDIDQDPRVQQAAQKGANAGSWAALAMGAPPDALMMETAQAEAAAMREQVIAERFEAMQAAYRKRQRDNKAFAETAELVISRLWAQAKIKARAKPSVRSALTIGVGWMKASWQERTGQDPLTRQRIADLRDNIAKAAKLRQDLEDQGGMPQEEAGLVGRVVEGVKSIASRAFGSGDTKQQETLADYEAQLAALESQAERVIARGFAIDFVNGEDITVAPGFEITRYLDAPWMDHRIPMPVDDIVAEFKLTKEQAAKVHRYKYRKPVMQKDESPLAAQNIEARDADPFEDGTGEDGGEWGMVHETWDRDANLVRTWVEGLPTWARPSMAPTATSRFYGFFLLAYGEIDGQRHPQSLVSRSAKLVDEYNRIGSAEREHRARVKPKMMFRKGQINGDETMRIVNGETAEYVGVETTQPNTPLSDLFYAVQYPQIDPALYDRSRIVAELERLWGIQEALSGGITVDKTATEASIQQSGMQARTGAQRDTLEDVLSELALFTAEIAMASLTHEDVVTMIGPDAMWPEATGPEDLARLVNVDIRAGSSGKPNTTAEREAWASLLPMLQQGIQRIGLLRNSTPADMADAEESLLRMTIERSGDRLDIEALLPKAGPEPMLPAIPGDPSSAQPASTPALPA